MSTWTRRSGLARRYPLALAVVASLALHAGTLLAAHFFLQTEAARPIPTQTIALVMIEHAPPAPDAGTPSKSKAHPKSTRTALKPPLLVTKLKATEPLPPPKPITLDPRKTSSPLKNLVPLFKLPPRRPAKPQPVEATLTPVPVPTVSHKPTPTPISKAAPAPLESTTVSLSPTPPRYGVPGLANPRPRYPWLARQRGEQGRVVVRVAVDEMGRVFDAEIKQSSGHGRLDRAALNAIRRWRFLPARRGTKAVTAAVEVPVTFRLSDD